MNLRLHANATAAQKIDAMIQTPPLGDRALSLELDVSIGVHPRRQQRKLDLRETLK